MATRRHIIWRDEDVIPFLLAYKQLECLWNTDLVEYKDTLMREEAYRTLLNTLNIDNLTMEDVKNKIKGIRTTYCKLLHLEREGVPQNTVFWYGLADSFLREVTEKKRLSMSKKQLQRRGKLLKRHPKPSMTVTSSPNTTTSTVINYLLNDMSNPASATISTAASHDDEFDHFARSIAIQLRRLPELDALDMMNDMQVMVINKKRQLLLEARDQPQIKRMRTISVSSEESSYSDEAFVVTDIIHSLPEGPMSEIKEETFEIKEEESAVQVDGSGGYNKESMFK